MSCHWYILSLVHPVIVMSCHWYVLSFGTSCHWYILSLVHPVIGTSCHCYVLSLVRPVIGTSCHWYVEPFTHNISFIALTWLLDKALDGNTTDIYSNKWWIAIGLNEHWNVSMVSSYCHSTITFRSFRLIYPHPFTHYTNVPIKYSCQKIQFNIVAQISLKMVLKMKPTDKL